MNEKIKRIHELLDELAEATKEAFPDYTCINANCENDGYITFLIVKWDSDKEKPVEKRLRRYLFSQTRIDEKSEWDKDTSDFPNNYCKKHGVFLED